jgi:glycosyltransferase involved in cell wall biosynthesis
MAINEALSYGLPIISSDFFSIPERVTHGKTGFLFKSPFPNYTADKVIDVEHANDSDIFSLVFEATEKGELRRVEMFLYDSMKKLVEDRSLLRRMSKAVTVRYEREQSNSVMLKRYQRLFDEALSHNAESADVQIQHKYKKKAENGRR